jgi:hypothetical protein
MPDARLQRTRESYQPKSTPLTRMYSHSFDASWQQGGGNIGLALVKQDGSTSYWESLEQSHRANRAVGDETT